MQAKCRAHEHTNSCVAQDLMLNFLFTFHRLYTTRLIKKLRLTSISVYEHEIASSFYVNIICFKKKKPMCI